MEKCYRLPKTLNLETTFFSGQAFRWEKTALGYAGATGDNAAVIELVGDQPLIYWQGSADETFWEEYFALGLDEQAIAARYKKQQPLWKAFIACQGLKILRQDVWETLCSFIISANNNDKRIRLILKRLCAALGCQVEIRGQRVYLFPSAQKIAFAGEATLRALGLGYRAPYLAKTAEQVVSGFDLQALRMVGYESALQALCTLPGVGDKVANCILLFSCGYGQAFPVDVWVERIMGALFGIRGSRLQIRRQSIARFGEDAGLVQQVLFHSAREGTLRLDDSIDNSIRSFSRPAPARLPLKG